MGSAARATGDDTAAVASTARKRPLLPRPENDPDTHAAMAPPGVPSTGRGTGSAKPRRLRLGRAMTNAERGRAFRERRAKHTGELEVDIYRLRAQIAELESVRDLWQNTRLMAERASDTGSLVRLVHEYLALFRFGFRQPVAKATVAVGPSTDRPSLVSPEIVQAKISYQEHFLRRVMAHDARVGDSLGPEASISNWNGYTIAHGNQRVDVHGIRAVGAGDHVVTEAHVTFNGKITETTFRVLYPRALHRHDLLAVFLNRPVRFHAVFRHEFTPDGQIQHEGIEIDFVEGLLATGAPLGDVLELLRLSIMSPVNTIAEHVEELDRETPVSPPLLLDETSSSASASDDDRASDKLRMEYILGP